MFFNELNHYSAMATVGFILTAKADKASVREGMELGADVYPTKPFRLKELLRRDRYLFRKTGSH